LDILYLYLSLRKKFVNLNTNRRRMGVPFVLGFNHSVREIEEIGEGRRGCRGGDVGGDGGGDVEEM